VILVSFDSRLHEGAACVSANVSLRSESKNRALVLDAFDPYSNKRTMSGERYWSPTTFSIALNIAPVVKAFQSP